MATCRFCSKTWALRPGVDATQHYCSSCSLERRAKANEAFGDREEIIVGNGRYIITRKLSTSNS